MGPSGIYTNPPKTIEDRFEPGSLIDARYRILSLLGAGGMGVVYKVRDETGEAAEVEYALKTIHLNHDEEARWAEMLRKEAKTAYLLTEKGIFNPNIVRVHQKGEWQPAGYPSSLPYIVMELVDGFTLQEWVDSEWTQTSTVDLLDLVCQIADGIVLAHQHDIIHCDLKPSNIMLGRIDAVPKLTDFGISRNLSEHVTSKEELLYSAIWSAPEAREGNSSKVGRHTDVYSLGRILYYLLTRRHFDHHVTYRPVNERNGRDGLDELVIKACAVNPVDRLQRAEEFRESLARYRADQGARTTPQSQWKAAGQSPTMTSQGLTESVANALGAKNHGAWQQAQEDLQRRRKDLSKELQRTCDLADREAFFRAFGQTPNYFSKSECDQWYARFLRAELEQARAGGDGDRAKKIFSSLILDESLSRPLRREYLEEAHVTGTGSSSSKVAGRDVSRLSSVDEQVEPQSFADLSPPVDKPAARPGRGALVALCLLTLLFFGWLATLQNQTRDQIPKEGFVKTYSMILNGRYLTIESKDEDFKVVYLTPQIPGGHTLVADEEYNEIPFLEELFGHEEAIQGDSIEQLQGLLCLAEDGEWSSTRDAFVSMLVSRIEDCSPIVLEVGAGEYHVFEPLQNQCSGCPLAV